MNAEKIVEILADDTSLPNRVARWVMAIAITILAIMIIMKFVTGAWTVG